MDNFKRYPRTLQEAFGPYTSYEIEGERPRDSLLARCAYWVMAALASGLALAQVLK